MTPPTTMTDWRSKGFGASPELRWAGKSGLPLYRCWGGNSSEWGTGYFSLEKPSSVIDAELRFNIVDWGNGVLFVSTFLLESNFPYWIGPVAHGPQDMSRQGTQVFVEPPLQVKVKLMKSREVLKQDASVSLRAGNA